MNDRTWPRFGAFSYEFKRGQLDDMIAAFQKSDLTAVQLGQDLLDEVLEVPGKAAGVRSRLNEAGIELVGLAGYQNLVAPDASRRRDGIDYLIRCIEIAPALGTTVVATETGTRNSSSDWLADPEISSPESWQLLFQAFDELLPIAERHGVVIALEGYVNNVVATFADLQMLLDRYASRPLQVVLDPFNYLSSSLMPRKEAVICGFLEQFEGRFVIAHLKDVDAAGAEVDTPAFGTGVFPFPNYVQFLRDRRPDLPVIHEHLPFTDISDASQQFLRYVRDLDAAG